MKKISQISVIVLSILVLSWFLPWLYSLLLPESQKEPFIDYSPVSGMLVATETGEDGEFVCYQIDKEGNRVGEFTRQERDSLLPQTFYTQLMVRKCMPESIAGKEASIPSIKEAFYAFRISPREVNKAVPPVHLIMESMPERVQLEDAKEVFVVNTDGGVTFTDMASNTVNAKRSAMFTEIFRQRGFKAPIVDADSDPSAKKQYDEGYLLIDSEGGLFHMKMQAGRPYMEKVTVPEGVIPTKAFIQENTDASDLGYIFTADNSMYILESEGHKLVKLPVDNVNPRNQAVTIMSNLVAKLVKVSDVDCARWYALDTDNYELLASYQLDYEPTTLDTVASYLFPYQLQYSSATDSYALPRVLDISWRAMLLGLLLAIVIVVVNRKKYSKLTVVSQAITTLIFGIFAFIPFVLIKH